MLRPANKQVTGRSTHPLEIPEIVQMCGKLLPCHDQVESMRVSKTWHANLAAITWKRVQVDVGCLTLQDEDGEQLPWDALNTYGCNVRHVEFLPCQYRQHGNSQTELSYCEIWKIISDLPGLLSVTLDGLCLEEKILPFFDKICARIRSLDIRSCTINTLDASMTSLPCSIQELSVSHRCAIDVVAFIARCPSLQVLSLGSYRPDHKSSSGHKHERKRFQNLAKYLDTEALPHLKYLGVKLSHCLDEEMESFIQSMRCLQSLQSCVPLGPLSLPGLRSHFHMICEIEICQSHLIPGLWQEIMSSCPALISAKNGFLSSDDIVSGEPWVCTSLRCLELTFGDSDMSLENPNEHSFSKIEAIEHTLLRRISDLDKLNCLYINETLPFRYESIMDPHVLQRLKNPPYSKMLHADAWTLLSNRLNYPKRLKVESLQLLSSLTQLKILSLGNDFCPVLDKSMVDWVASLMALESFHRFWKNCLETSDSVDMLLRRGVKVIWENRY